MSESILELVRKRLEATSTPHDVAAAQIGVTPTSLVRHLAGEYARSDSLAKYRLWLERGVERKAPIRNLRASHNSSSSPQLELAVSNTVKNELWRHAEPPARRHAIVDIFSGCGGLSLGFERFEQSSFFDTTLALDNEEPMIRVFNDNHPASRAGLHRGREVDVTDFMNESEIQAFYLDHLARSGQDPHLSQELRDIGGVDLFAFQDDLNQLDREFLDRLGEIRTSQAFVKRYRSIGRSVLSQTSVIAFHRSLKLPLTALGTPHVKILWASSPKDAPTSAPNTLKIDRELLEARKETANRAWDTEIKKLRSKVGGSGAGQLSSSAKRIAEFAEFARSESMTQMRHAWVAWRGQRDAMRIQLFDDLRVQRRLQELYRQGREISVLLGGPPCQGFSRIGRGKIRSLREQSVHAHEDDQSVDSRNQLLEQYVLFVSALAPRIFLFENVRGFQATVRTGKSKFDATDALATAIEEISSRGLSYDVASQIVDASDHLVPQVRERYLMVGVRNDLITALNGRVSPAWCLQLPVQPPVSLDVPLEGLGEPAAAGDDSNGDEGNGEVSVMRGRAHLDANDVATKLRAWISQDARVTDSHVARRPRSDDAAFFDLMGPGKRWMDYRCDEAPTLARIARLISTLRKSLEGTQSLQKKFGVTLDEARDLEKMVDGSLSLRLLLESIPAMPGETEHHLLNVNYLKKREGQHGDWLARMDPTRPSKTMVSHMGKDTYAYVHPTRPRTLSVREAARIQTFPDSYRFSSVGLVDAFRIIGNAVPPLLSMQFAERIAQILWAAEAQGEVSDSVDHIPRAAAAAG